MAPVQLNSLARRAQWDRCKAHMRMGLWVCCQGPRTLSGELHRLTGHMQPDLVIGQVKPCQFT
jgi:hypothetical protein